MSDNRIHLEINDIQISEDDLALLSTYTEANKLTLQSRIDEGKSTSTVLLADIAFRRTDDRKHDGPNYIKIDTVARTLHEKNKHEKARKGIEDHVPPIIDTIGPQNGRMAVIYAPASGSTLRAESLGKMMRPGEYNPAEIAAAITALNGLLRRWNPDQDIRAAGGIRLAD